MRPFLAKAEPVGGQVDLQIVEGKILASSLEVSHHFERQHKNVLRDIERILRTAGLKEFVRLNFERSSYTNSQNKPQPMYRLTEEGFSMLAMGFTGERALLWKAKYIEAFRKMRREIERPSNDVASAIAQALAPAMEALGAALASLGDRVAVLETPSLPAKTPAPEPKKKPKMGAPETLNAALVAEWRRIHGLERIRAHDLLPLMQKDSKLRRAVDSATEAGSCVKVGTLMRRAAGTRFGSIQIVRERAHDGWAFRLEELAHRNEPNLRALCRAEIELMTARKGIDRWDGYKLAYEALSASLGVDVKAEARRAKVRILEWAEREGHLAELRAVVATLNL